MSAPHNPDRRNTSGNQPDKARADHLEKERQRLTAEVSHLITGLNCLTTELNRSKATDQEECIEKLKAKLRNKIKTHKHERMLRKQYAAENEVLQRKARWLEGMLLSLGVSSGWLEQPKVLNAKPEEPDAEPMELDSEFEESLSESGESDISQEL